MSNMRNEYEAAEIVEIGKAQDVILGEKISTLGPDSANPGDPRQFVDSAIDTDA